MGHMNATAAVFPITADALSQLKSGLWQQHSDLTRAINKAHEEIRALDDCERGDVIDDSWSNSLKEAMFASYSMSRTQLRRVEAALERIAMGEFGICDVCGEAISLKRLQALPWASMCLDCQEQREQGRIQ